MTTVRILHVIDPSAPGGGACTLRLLADLVSAIPAGSHDVIVLGGRRHERLARRCGLDPAGVVPLVEAVPLAAARPLRRVIRAVEAAQGRFDLVHAWSVRAAAVTARAARDHPRVATLTVGPLRGLASRRMVALIARRETTVLAASAAVTREMRAMGSAGSPTVVLPPAVSPKCLDDWPRERVRERWEVGDDEFIIGLMSEPVSWADAQVATVIATRLIASGREVRIIAHPLAARRAVAERWSREYGRGDLFIVDDEVAEPWRIVRGLDASLHIGGESNETDPDAAGPAGSMLTGGVRNARPVPGVIPLLWSMAAQVPAVAERSDATVGIVEDGVSGLLVRPRELNHACDRLARLFDDRAFADQLGHAARRRVNERFEIESCAARLTSIYEAVRAGRRIDSDANATSAAAEEPGGPVAEPAAR